MSLIHKKGQKQPKMSDQILQKGNEMLYEQFPKFDQYIYW